VQHFDLPVRCEVILYSAYMCVYVYVCVCVGGGVRWVRINGPQTFFPITRAFS
jgi:hypothetical protein